MLRGARRSLRSQRFRYVQYELSPWLMARSSNAGSPLTLMGLLPSMGALCFDMLVGATFTPIDRPSAAPEYLEHLLRARNVTVRSRRVTIGEKDLYGPWDDILCWFPDSEN